MNVLSLFDGISCGRVALERACIEVNNYYASEIDKYAMQISKRNWPDIIQLGDVTRWREWDIDWCSIDLLFAGFPCQSWSIAGKQQGDRDPRGALMWDMLDILNHVKSVNENVKFLFENVKMKKENLDYVNKAIGVNPIEVNSALVSAQNRKRLYWTNIENITQPVDKKLLLEDVIELENVDEKYFVKENLLSLHDGGSQLNPGYKSQANTIHEINKKSQTLCAGTHGYALGYIFNYSSSGRGDGKVESRCYDSSKTKAHCLTKTGYTKRSFTGVSNPRGIRKLTPLECERLQTLPDNYTDSVSNTQRYKAIGNGWTVDVIAHILKGLNK